MQDSIKAVVVHPREKAFIKEIGSSIESLENLVGESISAFYPFDDHVAIICSDNHSLPPNRTILNPEGEAIEVIHGVFAIVGVGDEDYVSLTEEEAEKYKDMFLFPEKIINTNGQTKSTKYETF